VTPEEERWERIERTLEFLARHQAELSADIAKHSERIDKLAEQTAQVEQFLLRLGGIVEEQGRLFEEQTRRHDERLDRLAEAQLRTDERLNALIAVVERYFSNGRH
jgi:phage-related minor tail protein